MLKIKTASGAEYLIREVDGARELQRVGPHSHGIDYSLLPDGDWHGIDHMDDVVVGKSAYFSMTAGTFRLTTPVLTIEEVE